MISGYERWTGDGRAAAPSGSGRAYGRRIDCCDDDRRGRRAEDLRAEPRVAPEPDGPWRTRGGAR